MLGRLTEEVALARKRFISATEGVTENQAIFKPTEDSWSIIDNVEHMVWAEMGGINGMWKTADSVRKGKPLFSGEAIHAGLSIEAIIEKTWQPKEQVPETAKPRWGGPLAYWVLVLDNCQPLLTALVTHLNGLDPDQVIYPHVISGPLSVRQRFEFLRFHLDRHRHQIENIKAQPNYPKI